MIIPYWKNPNVSDRDRLQMLQQRHVDIQRLWKRYDQTPWQFMGTPPGKAVWIIEQAPWFRRCETVFINANVDTTLQMMSDIPSLESPRFNWLIEDPPFSAGINFTLASFEFGGSGIPRTDTLLASKLKFALPDDAVFVPPGIAGHGRYRPNH